LENVVRRKYLVVFVARVRWPALILGRDLRCRIKSLPLVLSNRLPEETVALAFVVAPRCIEKIADEIHRKLQCLERLLVVRATPSPHAPKSGRDVTNFNPRTAKLAIFHFSSPKNVGH